MRSRLRILVGLVLLAFAGLPAAHGADRAALPIPHEMAPDKRVALVIGNSAYEHAPALPNPGNDARDMAALLARIGFDVVEGTDLTQRGMEERIRDFAERSGDATVTVFYYAGHGMQVDGRNYLIPVDAVLETKTALEFETVDADTVLRHMVGANRVAIALLDACRDNPLSRRFTATRSVGVGRGLAMPTTGGGILIGFATAPGETAADGDGRNSPFAAALLRHLGTPGMEISQTMRRVMADVSSMTGDRQRPWVHSDIAVDFYILPIAASAGAGPQAPLVQSPVAPEPAAEPAVQLAARETAPAAMAPAGRTAVETIAVFENEKFDLCGHKEFSAVLLAKGGAEKVGISSRDRNVPGRSFRGFERSLALDTPTVLWDGCVVAASYDAKAGVTRITLSVFKGR